jgi:hypothetical protein
MGLELNIMRLLLVLLEKSIKHESIKGRVRNMAQVIE